MRPRTQASLAVSADGESWLLINASPDLSQQLRQSKALHPRSATRGSPIETVVLTGAEIDQVAGLLCLREREPFDICATAATLAALADNPMFGVLATDLVRRQMIVPGAPLALTGGLTAQLFTVPGKVPLYLEGEDPDTASETAANVGIEIAAADARIAYIPGAAAVTPGMVHVGFAEMPSVPEGVRYAHLPVMLPKKPRELPVLPPQDQKGEPKRTDPEDRDQLVGEGGRSRRLRPQATCHGTTRLETCIRDKIRVWTLF